MLWRWTARSTTSVDRLMLPGAGVVVVGTGAGVVVVGSSVIDTHTMFIIHIMKD